MAERSAERGEAALERRAEEALAKLDLPGMAALLSGISNWALPANPAIGLKSLVMSDGPAGVRGERWAPDDTAVQLPSPTALAATWDPELVRRAGRLLAQEARRKGVHVLLAPTVNLHRSPRAGRHFESYSEDPVLTGEIGAGFVSGVQDGGVAATVKHFVANDSETERFTVDVRASERTLRELYLAPFETIVAKARPWGVMSAYNSVNGTTMTENRVLNTVLREEWGFDGFVVSDWYAARDTVADALAGMDVAMPGPDTVYGDRLAAAVAEGRLPREAVKTLARRVLRLAARVGALDGAEPETPYGNLDGGSVAREAATRSIVLLRNHADPGEEPVLPLNPKGLRRIALLGAAAVDPRTGGGGSARVFPEHRISPLEGLRAALPADVAVVHARGADPRTEIETLQVVCQGVLYGADGVELARSELSEAATFDMGRLMGEVDVNAVRGVELTGRVEIDAAGAHVFEVRGAGDFTLVVDGEERFTGTLEIENPGDPGAVLFTPDRRRVEVPLGRGRPEFLLAKRDVDPANLELGLFSLGYSELIADPEEELTQAELAASSADVAVVVVGTSEHVESEGFDRSSLALPGRQDDLVSRVAAVNPRTVVVVNSGSPVLMPWREDVQAVLLSWFGGQEMGAALADVLLGTAEPSGRLPTTWPGAEKDVPVLDTAPVGGELRYDEGVFIGYRAWERAGRVPAYWFGHGLGYTTWRYESIAAEPDPEGEDLARVRVRITNAGSRAGREVVQLYLSGQEQPGTPERPRRWLAGFASVTAEPGQTAEVEMALPRRAAEVWDGGGWRLLRGTYQVMAGASYADIRLLALLDV